MPFNTPEFILTFLVFLVCWFLLPNKLKKWALLLFSYCFAWSLGGAGTAITLAVVTVLTWFTARHLSQGKGKGLLIIFITIMVLLLIFDKYFVFISDYVKKSFEWTIPAKASAAMIGVSYYVFSAISYAVDIYRGTDEADKSFLNTALWLAFFPKFIAGPICRHRDFKKGLDHLPKTAFDPERLKRGLLICSLGFFYKMVIADRIDLFVGSVFYNQNTQEGFTLIIALLLYSLQLYFDFAGYSMTAYGIAYAIDLPIVKNFDHPYFSGSISEFWRRWHISLSSWLRDYIYIPLGGNKKGKVRQYLNLLLTFLVSGLWHGAGFTFVIWGVLFWAIQIFENEIAKKIKIPSFLSKICTFLFITATHVFFRADSVQKALQFYRLLPHWNPEILTDGTLTAFSLDFQDWIVLLSSLCIAFLIEVVQYRGISIYQKLQARNIAVRWAVYYVIIIVLLLFGKYGPNFDAGSFIYFKF